MSPTDDYSGEMALLRQVDDATAERLLAGRAASAELEPVATVLRALREVSSQPVRPSDTLREQMAAGVFTGGPVYSYQPATGGVVRRVAAALVVKIAKVRLVTKLAAAAVAAAVLSTATAGFAGSLPDPVQNRFETVVESVTPYDFREKTGDTRDDPVQDPGDRGGPAGGAEDDGDGVGEGPATEDEDPTDPGNPGNGQGNGDDQGDGEGNGQGDGEGNGQGNGDPGNGQGNDNGNPGNGNGNGGGNGQGNENPGQGQR